MADGVLVHLWNQSNFPHTAIGLRIKPAAIWYCTLSEPTAGNPDRRRKQQGLSMSEATFATILIVDDDYIIRRMLKEALEEHGYRVLLASNGAQALKVFEEHTADISVVLTDIKMPLMNGPAFVAELLMRGLPRQLPIVFMSASVSDVPPGFPCILKPFRPDPGPAKY
jgi:CheY-like chemotaxis protein